MAELYYGGTIEPIVIPDRVLAHLKVVVAAKLRRSESFTVSWRTDSGRETLWLQPSIALRFVFNTAEPELLDRTVLTEMSTQANASSGLMLVWDAAGDPVTAQSATDAPPAKAKASARR